MALYLHGAHERRPVDLLGARDHVVVSLPGADEMFGRACESKQFARSTPATTHRAGVLG